MNILEARRRLLEGGVKKRTAAGNPIVVRSLARMYPGLNIYGWSKQDGTPSPENQVPIVSAGSVMTTGAQLFNFNEATYLRCNSDIAFEPYTGGQPVANPYEGEINVTISDGGTQSQFLTVSAPGGLPGIPVDASKLPEGMTPTYVDESGQAWVCDEVDFKRGKYVQRVWKGTFDGSENWIKYGTEGATSNYGFLASNALPEPMNYRNGFCNQYKVAASSISNNAEIWFRFGAGSANATAYAIHVEQYDPSLEDFGLANWKAHLAAHPLEVMTYLETPIETDLPAEEIAAYEALHTYSPATTVSNDADVWMKVGYKTRKSLEVTT